MRLWLVIFLVAFSASAFMAMPMTDDENTTAHNITTPDFGNFSSNLLTVTKALREQIQDLKDELQTNKQGARKGKRNEIAKLKRVLTQINQLVKLEEKLGIEIEPAEEATIEEAQEAFGNHTRDLREAISTVKDSLDKKVIAKLRQTARRLTIIEKKWEKSIGNNGQQSGEVKPSKKKALKKRKQKKKPGKKGPGKKGPQKGKPDKKGPQKGKPGKPGKPGKKGPQKGKPGKKGPQKGKPGKKGPQKGKPGKKGPQKGKPGKKGPQKGKPGKKGPQKGKPGKKGPQKGKPGKKKGNNK